MRKERAVGGSKIIAISPRVRDPVISDYRGFYYGAKSPLLSRSDSRMELHNIIDRIILIEVVSKTPVHTLACYIRKRLQK